MVGGGNPPAPGEISLAHHGVLFLDELPEFHRRALEVLRQPLEGGVVTIARALRSTTFPARFVLITAMNPCPCGYLGDPRHACKCSGPLIERYLGNVSGQEDPGRPGGVLPPVAGLHHQGEKEGRLPVE
jgi:magnesium chelatase family protein